MSSFLDKMPAPLRKVFTYLPEEALYVDCATCLFWRGAVVGGLIVFLVMCFL